MTNKTIEIDINDLFGYFNMIFDQQMKLYNNWIDADVPKRVIIWWVSYFLIDLILEDHDEEFCRVHFNKMIDQHDKHH